MNPRLTGWLAWSVLAVIIAVPSAKNVFFESDNDRAVDDVVLVSVAEPVVKQPFFGPIPARNTRTNDPFALPVRAPAKPRVASIKVQEPDVLLTPVVTRAPRIVGDPGMAINVTPRVSAEPDLQALDAVDTPVLISDVVQPASVGEPIPIEFRVGDGAVLDVAITDLVPTSPARAVLVPVPMPVSLRPAAPIVSASFEGDVRKSIENIRTARRTEMRVENFDNNGAGWGDDPRFRRGGRRLDTFASGEVFSENYAGNSAFYELWAEDEKPSSFRRNGSFEEQLPARRGRGIRMDLLQ